MTSNERDPAVIHDVAAFFGTTVSQQDIESLGTNRIVAPQDETVRAGEDDIQDDINDFFEEG